MTVRLVQDQPRQCHGEWHEVVNDAIDQDRAKKGGCRDLRQAGDDRGFEYAEAAGNIADCSGGEREHVQACERLEADAVPRREQHVEHAGGYRQVGAADHHLHGGGREARQRERQRADLERLAPCGCDHQVRGDDSKERGSDTDAQ
jgi:hypothetical protein